HICVGLMGFIKESMGEMNAVFYPWPIQESWERSDAIADSGRQDTIFRCGLWENGPCSWQSSGLRYTGRHHDQYESSGVSPHIRRIELVAIRSTKQHQQHRLRGQRGYEKACALHRFGT